MTNAVTNSAPNAVLDSTMTSNPAQDAPPDMLQAQLDSLSQQVQLMHEQLTLLTDEALEARRRRREWDELRTDLSPIARDLYTVSAEQLNEIQAYVQLEDILHLLKRLARNTHSINDLLDQLESLQDFMRDLSPLTQDIFAQTVNTLDQLEQKGYFGLLRQTQYVADQVAGAFSEEDVRLLGDNIVTILTTIRALTQPEIMNLVNNLTQSYQTTEEAPLPTSLLGLAGQMRDPQVRRGLAITMQMLKHIAQQTPDHRRAARLKQESFGRIDLDNQCSDDAEYSTQTSLQQTPLLQTLTVTPAMMLKHKCNIHIEHDER